MSAPRPESALSKLEAPPETPSNRQVGPIDGQVRPDDLSHLTLAARAVCAAMAEERPVEEGITATLAAIQNLLGAEHGFVYTLDEGGATMTLRVGTGLFTSMSGAACAKQTGLAGKVWASGTTVNIEDYEAWTGRGIEIQAGGARALVALPVFAGPSVLAVVGLAHSRPQHRFPSHFEERVESLLHLLAMHLMNDRATDRARSQLVERDFAERELRQMRAEEQHVLDLIPASIWVKDRENRIVRANRAAAARMGLTVEEIEGQFLWELDPENAAGSYREDLEVIESGEARLERIEESVEPSGERRWWKVDRAPIADSSGEPAGVVVVSRDVTLEHLAESRLEASRRATELANRVKDNYIATMSHEVRAPLHRMIGLVDRLLHSDLPDGPRQQVEALYTSADTLLTLVQDVLDFSRAEAGNLPVQVQDFELRNLLEDVLEVLAQVAHQRGVELASHVDARVPRWVAGDPIRVRQILVQMLATAMRSARGGEVMVMAKQVMNAEDRVEIRFEVRATASTLQPREVERLFDPVLSDPDFDPGDRNTADFGLALASRMVELLRGKIGVETEADDAFCCWCALPLERAESVDADIVTVSQPRPGARVLVVDDSPMVSGFLQQQLTELRMLVDSATSVKQGLEMLEAAQRDDWPYELCLLDDNLAGEKGRGLIEKVRQAADKTKTKWVLMAPFGHPLTQEEIDSLGLSEVLSRPVRHLRLRDILTRALGVAEGAPSPPSESIDHLARTGPSSKVRVLLVEDQPQEQKLLSIALRRMGCEVHLATNATEAVDRVREDDYELVLLDAQVSAAGAGTVDRIRQAEAGRRHTPVVAMVPEGSQDTRERCLAAGMDGCLVKPPSYAELRQLLRERLALTV